MELNLGLLIPFIGTTIGSAMVFLMKKEINRKVEKFLLGFASGVMIAASVWSLLMPSIEMAEEQGVIAWVPASIGFIIGILFLLWIDYITTKIKEQKQEETQSDCIKKSMLFLAVTLHNIPEGMAVGVALAGALLGNVGITMSGAIALTNLVVPILPYFLSFAAGTMIYVVVEELIPQAQQGKHTEIGTIGVSIGFIIMMILDVALG